MERSKREVMDRLGSFERAPEWRGRPPGSFTGVTDDSRRVRPGDLFCAVRGHRVDGHRFLEDALRAGAAAAVVEEPREELALPQLVVEDGRRAVAHLAALFHGDPGASLTLVGVTGTNGKTTTVLLLRHLLAERGPAAALGTLGVVGPDGCRESGALTTPGPVELQRTLADLRDRGVRTVALELSSHALDQQRAAGSRLEAVVFTNLSREHLEYHRGMEDYRKTKWRAAGLVRRGGWSVVNADEPAWEGMPSGEARRVTYGLGEGAGVRAEGVRSHGLETRWTLRTEGGASPVRLPMPGEYNVYNALGAAACALALGLDRRRVSERLSSVPPVPGRMEVLQPGPRTVLRDYAHTPGALRLALAALDGFPGRRVLVFGCGGERDAGKRPLMGREATRGADFVYVTTDNPRSEDPGEIARQVTEGMEEGRYRVLLDRREAIARALAETGPGDVVLLAGKGHEDYQELGDGREPFDEARIVAELTAGGGDGP